MKIFSNFIKIFICFSFTFSNKVNAECNFKTAEYINELNNPSSINKINIIVPKSRKYLKNFLRILQNKQNNGSYIPAELKKNFQANINVIYDFGSCTFKGEIRQHGDLPDHIILRKGNPQRSLKIKLDNGNILNATRFRVLIPETRNSINEILGSVILNELGFITPQNSEVMVSINNKNYKMIFSEDARKEMLERNLKREGPIFTGDESLFWSEKVSHQNATEVSLARLINHKWFLKGKSSQEITLNSISKLQNLYLEQKILTKNGNQDLISNLDNRKSKIFKDYSFILLAMNGHHGLHLHNRRFFFNSLKNEFEPIYADGNLDFLKKLSNNYLNSKNLNNFDENYKFSYHELLNNQDFKENILLKFKKRVIAFGERENLFFEKSFNNLIFNINFLQDYIDRDMHLNNAVYGNKISRNFYLKKSKDILPNQLIIYSAKISENNIISDIYQRPQKIFTKEEFSKILRKKNRGENRYVFLPNISITKKIDPNIDELYIPEIEGELLFSKGIKINVDKSKKTIKFNQSKPTDWVKISNALIKEWNIKFLGIVDKNFFSSNNQRFNNYGLTGCLNIYNSELHNASFKVSNGKCEDSFNLINSSGNIRKLEITNAYQDALDMDFSKLKLDRVYVYKSGNDCLDLSGGNYKLMHADLISCKDNGISIGEKSTFRINNVFIENAYSGITVKDLSQLYLKKAKINSSKFCISAYQKKQEFGGAFADIKSLDCNSNNFKDYNSVVNIK